MPLTYSNADAIVDVGAATVSVLDARNRLLANVVDVIQAERKAIMDEIRRRERDMEAQFRVGALKADDKAVLRRVLNGRS